VAANGLTNLKKKQYQNEEQRTIIQRLFCFSFWAATSQSLPKQRKKLSVKKIILINKLTIELTFYVQQLGFIEIREAGTS
jgi:hypothetical protein